MATPPDAPPALGEPRLGARWVLRALAGPSAGLPRRPARTYAVRAAGGGPELFLELHRVPDHPLRACYPYGAHDLAIGLVLPSPDEAGAGPDPAARLLRDLVPALFTLAPRCRRVIAAPDEDDTAAQLALEQGGFRRITEADLPGGSVVLFAAEPPAIAGLSTALDDMPH
ncbi:GNAT family N-acetyltransferase [Streptomyces geranii]|uniref:GNAT family N-acetyltransferase n=1 Tax=Streptomyces geranii TaxID=2058923 RepID=UPI000D0429F3|nr:GNAT family N-acetyltransferase [Streptomyces geranii]